MRSALVFFAVALPALASAAPGNAPAHALVCHRGSTLSIATPAVPAHVGHGDTLVAPEVCGDGIDQDCDGLDLACPDDCVPGEQDCPAPDCYSLHLSEPELPSGNYLIDPAETGDAFEATCDMETEGGGWTRVLHQAPWYGDPSWTSGAPYGAVGDESHISRAYAELDGFTDARWHDYHATSPGVYVEHDLYGDVSDCVGSGSLFELVNGGPIVCLADWIGSEPQPHAISLTIDAETTWQGCPGIRARIGYYFYTWDGGVSGSWQGQGVYGYKTNNTVLGTSCVFDEGDFAGRRPGNQDLWVR